MPGVVLLLIGLIAPVSPNLVRLALWMGASLSITALAMVVSSKFGKLKARDSLLDAVSLSPSDTVLDVGCGRGLLLIGAAKRVTKGRAVGIDLWSTTDQFRNSSAATIANAAAEGVTARTEVRDGDMRQLPFENESFDAVVSSLAIHNLPGKEDREKSVREIARVLKSGGRVGIIDIANVDSYRDALWSAGVTTLSKPAWSPWIFPPARFVVGTKQA